MMENCAKGKRSLSKTVRRLETEFSAAVPKIAVLAIGMLFAVTIAQYSAVPADARVSAYSRKPMQKKGKVAPNVEALQKKAFTCYLQRNYLEAAKLFKQCFELDPSDVSVNYYLGASALFANDVKTAEHALCRVVVMSSPDSEFSTLAMKSLKQWRTEFHGIEPYSQLENGRLMRWEKGKGPIKVWVSDGLQLPRGFVGAELDNDKCKALYSMFQRPGFFNQLETVVHYVPSYRDMVKNGINDWGWVASEGIVSFEFTEDPTKADVLYFWCPESGAGSVGRTFYPWTRTSNARCIVHIETEYLRKWGSRVPTELRKTSAHEFGHVLGLNQHSNNINDLMAASGKTISYREMTSFSSNSAVTKNDYATLRALYELPAGDLYSTMGR